MRQFAAHEMADLVALFAVLLIFFSIDLRGRDPAPEDPWHAHMFSWLSRVGGVATALAMTLAWVNMFVSDASPGIHIALVAVPGTMAVLCAIALGVEMLFQSTPRP